MNVCRAVDFDEGEILVGLTAGLILAGVAHQVGEDGHVVRDFSADGDRDGFAASMMDIGGQACTISEGEDAKKDEKVTKGHLVSFLHSLIYSYKHVFILFSQFEIKNFFDSLLFRFLSLSHTLDRPAWPHPTLTTGISVTKCLTKLVNFKQKKLPKTFRGMKMLV